MTTSLVLVRNREGDAEAMPEASVTKDDVILDAFASLKLDELDQCPQTMEDMLAPSKTSFRRGDLFKSHSPDSTGSTGSTVMTWASLS